MLYYLQLQMQIIRQSLKQKKVLIILALVVVIGVIGGLLWFRSRQTAPEVLSPTQRTSEVTPTQTGKNLLTWNDQAGFTFQYQPGMKINKHDEDQENYAHLDLYLDSKDGAVKILASDTKYKTVGDWATKEKKNAQTGTVKTETTLSGKPAMKITFPETKETIIGIIDEGILFTIELTPDKEGSWQKVFDQTVSSFTLVYPTAAPSSQGSSAGSDSDVVEEEEIIE